MSKQKKCPGLFEYPLLSLILSFKSDAFYAHELILNDVQGNILHKEYKGNFCIHSSTGNSLHAFLLPAFPLKLEKIQIYNLVIQIC